jgi:hypothetical protein
MEAPIRASDVQAIRGPLPQRGYVYAILSETQNAVKIGWACDVRKRLVELQCGNPAPLRIHSANWYRNAKAVEAEAHRSVEHAGIRGEWYSLEAAAVQGWLDDQKELEDFRAGLFDDLWVGLGDAATAA